MNPGVKFGVRIVYDIAKKEEMEADLTLLLRLMYRVQSRLLSRVLLSFLMKKLSLRLSMAALVILMSQTLC